jgi:hypothetical protein
MKMTCGTWKYGDKPADPGWVQSDPNRVYVITSDAPEPGTLGFALGGIIAFTIISKVFERGYGNRRQQRRNT